MTQEISRQSSSQQQRNNDAPVVTTEATPLISRTIDPLLSIISDNNPNSSCNHNASTTTTTTPTTNGKRRRIPLPPRSKRIPHYNSTTITTETEHNENGIMDTSDGSRNSTTSSLQSHIQSFREQSIRFIQYIAHHTGSIGRLGSMAIAINSLTGPAMLNLPATFVRSGILPTTFTVLFVCLLSSRCSLHMANIISIVGPTYNYDFQQEVEYSDVFCYFLGQRWYIITQIIFLCCITCLNISSIVDTSQVVDTFIGNWIPGGTCALQLFSNTTTTTTTVTSQQQSTVSDAIAEFYSSSSIKTSASSSLMILQNVIQFIRWDRSECTIDEVDQGICLPFAKCDGIVFTLGTLITTLLFLPLALLDLKENAWWQVAGLFILLIVSLQFIIQFTMTGLQPSNLTWWGNDWNDLLGVIIFNFALVIAIPAWLYEREPHVDVPMIINYSSFVVVILYMLIGLLGAMAIPHVADNMLESMMSGAFGTALSLGASLFAFAIVGLGIPLFSVLTRLNLTGSGLCSLRTGNILAVYGPFAAAWMLYDGQSITKLLSWGGIIFTSLIAFILPLILSIYVARAKDAVGSIQVYSGWFKSKTAHLTSLYVLFAMACSSIFIAILGNLVDFDGTPDDPP